MSPPIREGSGNDIGSIRLGDGSEISEVRTGAGDVLFSGSAIPDTSMFNSAIYQFYAGSSSASYGSSADFPEVLDDSVPDAAAQNSPTLTENYESSGYDMFDYTDTNSDFHSVSPDAEYSNNDKLSVFALCYPQEVTDFASPVFAPNDKRELNFNDDSYSIAGGGGFNTYDAGTASSNTLDTIGFSWDADGFGDGNVFKLFGGGSQVFSTGSFTMGTLDGLGVEIGSNSARGLYFDGGIAEIVVCSGSESESNYQEFHNKRLSGVP